MRPRGRGARFGKGEFAAFKAELKAAGFDTSPAAGVFDTIGPNHVFLNFETEAARARVFPIVRSYYVTVKRFTQRYGRQPAIEAVNS